MSSNGILLLMIDLIALFMATLKKSTVIFGLLPTMTVPSSMKAIALRIYKLPSVRNGRELTISPGP